MGHMQRDLTVGRSRSREGFVLLVVIAFIAVMLPLIIVVLATVSTETVSVAGAIKGSKAEAAAEQATTEAISIVLQEKQLPDYWASQNQSTNAIIADDGFGVRRDSIVNNGAGPDGVYGTEDDYWIGPRKDRSFLPGDDPDDPRNYDYDFRYLNLDGPVYLAQRWAYDLGHSAFYFVPTPQMGGRTPIELYNQFAAVQSDQDGDGMNEGFIPDALDMLLLPGYYASGVPPPGTPMNLDLTSATIDQDSLAFRVRTYEGLFESLDQGPVPSTLTRSYGSVTDENGRLNLNIFCKKVRVWAPESASYDSAWWGTPQMTSDFNNNGIQDEYGWHWIDNPLFPDRDTTRTYPYGFNADGTPPAANGIIDFGGFDPLTGLPNTTPDGQATDWLGETVQHLYSSGWVHSAVKSKQMLMALPGITEDIAENILMALNPDLSTLPDPPSVNGGTPAADNLRLDAPNITPPLTTFNATFGGGGQITSFYWDYGASAEDDLPLPPPRPFTDINELLNVRGMTPAKFERIKDLVTVYSYDTNVIGNYITDVSSTVDPVNPPQLPPGASRRPIPGYLVDRDTVSDLRYDLNMPLYDTSMSALREQADVLYNFIMNHLPKGVFDKFTLPVVDRAGRTPSWHKLDMSWYRNTSWDMAGYPYNVAEAGHEMPAGPLVNPEPGCGYPALDPPFSRDSALSILLYRYGMYDEDAYHHYGPTVSNPRIPHPGIPIPGTRSFIPIFDPIIVIPGLIEFYFQPTYIPDASADQNAVIPGHLFTSVADVLEVPLYKFSQFSVDMMADPPSDYICEATGKDEVTVHYLVSLSDVLKVGEYDDNGTPTDLTDDAVAPTYDIYFDYNNDGTTDDSVSLTFGQDLRLVGPPPTEQRGGIITTFDQETGQRYLEFEHTFDAADVPAPDPARAGTANGDFAYDAFGNPFIIARVLGVRAAGTAEEILADQIVRVYLQVNCNTEIPLKANILAIRQGADTFRVISAVSGGVEEPNAFRLYDWQFTGETQGYDGTYPPQAGQPDPRVVTITPGTDTITLTVYDLYAAGSGPCWPGLPVTPPSVALPPGIITGGQVNPAFPAAPYPARGLDSDTAQVSIVGASPNVRAEVAVEPPVIDQNGTAAVHVGIFGGESPYDFRVRIFDAGGVQIYNYQQFGVSRSTYMIEPTDAAGNSLFGIAGNYSVVLTVNDSQAPPSTAIDSTNITVGASAGNGRSFANVPNMVISLDVEALEATQKGFRATANVSGGRGEYGYYWEVFDETGAIVHDVDGAEMRRSGSQPSEDFVFRADISEDHVYLVKVMVIDQADKNPNNATNTVLATDSAMVVLATAGGDLERQPMAVLAAEPPGNASSSLDTSAAPAPLIYGAGPQPLLCASDGTYASPGTAEVSPEIAPIGGVIELYGFNFNTADPDGPGPLPAGWNNEVHFGGSVIAHPFEVMPDPSYAGPPPVRQIMRVVVPQGALSGWVHVEVNVGGNGGISNSAFFQTHFLVSFDLVASITPNTTRDYTYDVDFQGDGIYDVHFDSSQGGGGGAIRHADHAELQHDYAQDGFGNYQAVLRVTDRESQRVMTSRQLVQIRNLRSLMDSANNSPEAFGLCVSVMPEYSQAYPMPGDAINVRSFVGGITSFVGVKYKWNIDGNTIHPGAQSFSFPSPVTGGTTIGLTVSPRNSADGRYVSPGIPTNYYANIRFNFTTTDANIFNLTLDPASPLRFEWDFDGDGTVDYFAPAEQTGGDLYTGYGLGRATHTFNTIDDYHGVLTVRGVFMVTDTSNNEFIVPLPAAGVTVPLPTVSVTNVLGTLQLPALSNDADHVIAVTVGTEDYDPITTRSHKVYATDSVLIPSSSRMQNDVFGYIGTQGPYSLANTPDSVNFTLSSIYGQGSTYNFLADINTDGYFEIGQLGFFNPQPGMRVTAHNGVDRLNVGAINSFPTMLPGVNFDFVNVHIPIDADKGVYNSYALVRDNPASGLPAYSFDTQEIMVGGNRGGGGPSGLPVDVDIFIDPLVGVTSQGISLHAYPGGGDAPYGYFWTIRYVATGQLIQFANPEQADLPNPVFVATRDAADELGASVDGDYTASVAVTDGRGVSAVSRTVTFSVVKAPLNAQLLAFPPAAAMNEGVNFVVHVDGGTPPYDVQISYNDPDDPGAVERRTTSDPDVYFRHTYTSTWLDRTVPANDRFDDPEDGVNVEITVVDSDGNAVSPATSINATQKVLIGERLPLNISMAVAPSAGSYNFDVQVNYTVSGGRKMSLGTFGNLALGGGGSGGDDYFVSLTLMSTSGGSVYDDLLAGGGLSGAYYGTRVLQTTVRTESSTLINPWGSDGIFMNGDAGEVYDPVYFHIPYPGNYFIMAWVTDGSGEFAIDRAQVYALGYLVPGGTGGAPQVRRDRDGRPLHAVRIWTDPLYSGSLDGDYTDNSYRLREADIQIFGDLLTVDPNPSFVSPGFLPAKDPADATPFDINYLENPQTPTPIDFYDTFTIGRVNINTASEEVLTALFSKIIKWRDYYLRDDPGGAYKRGERNYAGDVYLSLDEARALAKAVVEYRTAYYDGYKPRAGAAEAGYDYDHGVSADPYATGDIRVDHLPVIGPWDGAIPRAYSVTARDNAPASYNDSSVMNVWDNFRGGYYNLDRGSSLFQFYAPSDIAVVREQLPGESDEDYARYLNDTLDNRVAPNADAASGDEMGFDAREYFTYSVANNETRADARNRIAIIQSNGETGYTYIPNPPFRSLFDLYKVVGVSDPNLYALVDPVPESFEVQDSDSDGVYDLRVDPATGFTVNQAGAPGVRTLSGPSLFRYAEVWDNVEMRFVVVANYLDDLAPYVTTRSYTFRTVGVGGVSISGESEVVPVTLDMVQRDRSVTKVIDVGKLMVPAQGGGLGGALSKREPYTVVYEEHGGR